MVIRKDNVIKIDWYQKPTSSGRIINFYSCQPKQVIMNTASNLIRRILSISDEQFHKDNINRVKTILKKNSFPDHVINNLIKRNKYIKNTNNSEETPKIYKSMIYVPQLSERIEKSDIYNSDKFKIAPTSRNTLRQLFTNPKSKIDKMEKSNLIYKINCNGDNTNQCQKVYIGTTKNKLKTRIAGHKSDIKNINNFSTQKTALAMHCAASGHSPDFENVAILQREEKTNKRLTTEMLYIIDTPQERRMNYKADTERCAQTYRHIINKRRKKL